MYRLLICFQVLLYFCIQFHLWDHKRTKEWNQKKKKKKITSYAVRLSFVFASSNFTHCFVCHALQAPSVYRNIFNFLSEDAYLWTPRLTGNCMYACRCVCDAGKRAENRVFICLFFFGTGGDLFWFVMYLTWMQIYFYLVDTMPSFVCVCVLSHHHICPETFDLIAFMKKCVSFIVSSFGFIETSNTHTIPIFCLNDDNWCSHLSYSGQCLGLLAPTLFFFLPKSFAQQYFSGGRRLITSFFHV